MFDKYFIIQNANKATTILAKTFQDNIQAFQGFVDGQNIDPLREDENCIKLKNKIDPESSDDEEQVHDKKIKSNSIKNTSQPIISSISQFILIYLQKIPHNGKIYQSSEDYLKQSNISEIQNQLLSNKQFEKCSQYESELSVVSIQPTKYFQVVTIWIQYGWYKTKVLILNNPSKNHDENPLHHCAQINSFGAFGSLYFVQFKKVNYAIKCIPIDFQNQSSQDSLNKTVKSIIVVLKEFFFLKLFSTLKIGPKLKQCFGFDLIISNDCIEFSMELCKPIKFSPQNEQELKENLRIMHLLQIIHRDIKPDNLMWSKQFKKPVFIDFGSTNFIKQSLGQKSMTRFVGTIGFVSPQMRKIFVEKKGMADLYFNDLYGMNQSFEAFKRCLTNENNSEQEQNIALITDSTFTIMLLKYKLLTKRYDQFFQIWSVLQRYQHYELGSIEYEILEFLIDLKPNQFLLRLYSQMSDETRSLKQFEGLKDIYLNESSTALSIWTKFHQKQIKFKKTFEIYKQISLQYEGIMNIQKRISIILLERQSLINFVSQSLHKFKNGNYFTEQHILTYFVALSYYCVLAHDKFGIKIDDKINAAIEALEVIDLLEMLRNQQNQNCQFHAQTSSINLCELLFVCPIKELQPIAIIYQFMMFKIWPHVPPKFKNDILKSIISSLSLMGYPFYIDPAKWIFKYYLFRNHDSQKLVLPTKFQDRLIKIMDFWKSISMINVYIEICYDRQESNFKMRKQIFQKLAQEVTQYQKSLMCSDINNDFLILNHHFYQFHTKTKLIQYSSENIRNILYRFQNQVYVFRIELDWSTYYHQYKECIRLLLNFLPGKVILPVQIGIYKETKPIDLKYEQSMDLSLHFSSFLKYCAKSWNLQRIGKVLKIINEIIVYSKISERFFVDFRIYFAWKMRDIPTMKRMASIVFEATQKISPYNFSYLYILGLIMHKILLLERIGFWDFIVDKLVCYDHLSKIVTRMRQYILFYTNEENLPHPDEILVPFNKTNQRSKKQYFIDQCTTVVLTLNQTEQKLFITFNNVKTSISLLTSLLRYAQLIFEKGLKKDYDKLFPNANQTDIVTHLRMILPQKLRESLFLSQQTQQELKGFLVKSIASLSTPTVSLSKYYNANWNINNKTLIEIPNKNSDNFHYMIEKFSKNYKHEETVQQNSNFIKNIKPSPRVAIIYYLSKLIVNNQNEIDDYRDLIKCYTESKRDRHTYKLMFETHMIKYLIRAYIYCESPFNQFLEFLLDTTSFLKQVQDKFAPHIFREAIWDKLFCVCQNGFPFQKKDWKPVKFIEYIHSKRKTFNQISHPYMGLVMASAIRNKFAPIHIKRDFLLFGAKSIPYLPATTREFILQQMYSESFIQKLIIKGFYRPAQYNQNYVMVKPEIKLKYDESTIRSEYYHAEKYFKTQKRISNVNKLIEERFNVKKKSRPWWKLPFFIQAIYKKKLVKYHSLLNGFEQKVRIEPHFQLLRQFQ